MWFYARNYKSINIFLNVLREVGYEDNFINEYLLSQNLNLPCEEILSIDNFTLYCEKKVNIKDNKVRKK